MVKDNQSLNKWEMAVMRELWGSESALTSMELRERRADIFHYAAPLHTALNSLLDKKMIAVSGLIISGKKNARQFKPCISERDFSVREAVKNYGESRVLPNVAMALVKAAVGKKNTKEERESDRKFMEELEKFIDDYREGRDNF